MHTALVLATLLSQAPALDARAPSLSAPAPAGASLLATAEAQPPPSAPVTRWVRVPTMALSGLVLGAAAAAGGVAGPQALGLPRTGGGDLGPSYAQVALGGAGALFASSAGVWGASRLMDGRGSYGGTLLGTVAGLGAGAAVIVAGVSSGNDVLANASLWTGAALPVAGAILGHELSAPGEPAGLQLTPALAVGREGAQAGLSGRF